jgi:hypothetical protein
LSITAAVVVVTGPIKDERMTQYLLWFTHELINREVSGRINQRKPWDAAVRIPFQQEKEDARSLCLQSEGDSNL